VAHPETQARKIMARGAQQKDAEGTGVVEEVCRYFGWEWDVGLAHENTRGREPDDQLPVKDWADALLPDEDESLGAFDLLKHHIDVAHALGPEIDLSKPLLGIVFETWDEKAGEVKKHLRIIDGHHRLYRARREGLETLPIILLSAEEERRVRLRGPYPDEMGPNEKKRGARRR
jgi:hypothetical protein